MICQVLDMIVPEIGRSRRMMVFRRLIVKTRCSAGRTLRLHHYRPGTDFHSEPPEPVLEVLAHHSDLEAAAIHCCVDLIRMSCSSLGNTVLSDIK